jgi:hypothetical protein
MNKAKMRNALERNKLEEDQMSILLLLPPLQRRPPQQYVEFVRSSDAYLEWHKPK